MRFLLLSAIACLVAGGDWDTDDVAAPIEQLVTEGGFTISNFTAKTEDGCILKIFRVRDPAFGDAALPPVLLQHGILDSADTWTLNFANGSLAMLAAAAGFDVYLGNSRGNKYSTGRSDYGKHTKEYWFWSWQEMAEQDLPTTLAAIREVAGHDEAVPVVCHSQGCTLTIASLLEGHVNSSDVSLVVGMAPVAHMAHSSSLLLDAVARLRTERLAELIHWYDFLPSRPLFQKLLPEVCGPHPHLCDDVISLLCGYNSTHLDNDRLPVYVSHFPCGTSVFSLGHYAQEIRAAREGGSFAKYDYEWGLGIVANAGFANLKHYGQLLPPRYDLGQWPSDVNFAIFAGSLDTLADPKDVAVMLDELPSGQPISYQMMEGWGHVDFVWGDTAATDLYPNVITLLTSATS